MPPLGLAKGGHKFFKGGQCPPPRGGREVPWMYHSSFIEEDQVQRYGNIFIILYYMCEK